MLNKNIIFTAMFVLLLVAGSPQACGDLVRGEGLAVDCADCHGDDGLGDEDVPGIAGLEKDYILKQLKEFKSGERVDEEEMMLDYVEDLSEQDMADLAAYFATLPTE